MYYSLYCGSNFSNEAVACGAWVRRLLESVQRVWSCECLGWIMECVDVDLCLDLDWTILYLLNLQCAAVCSPLPCCRHTGQLSLVPSFKWHSPCKRLGDLCMVVQIKSQFARSKRVFLHKLSYGFSLKRCKKRLSHLLCQRLHPWPYWCTTPRSLPPCSCTPITWEATSSPDAIELPPTPSHLFYHWNKAAVIALQASSYEVGISSPKFRFSEARVVLLNVAVSFLNFCF